MSDAIDPPRAADLLMGALASTFADMAFIDVEPASFEREISSPVRVAIDVLKPISCRIEIECPASLKQRIQATLFEGQAEGRTGSPSQDDSLLEILNVAAGVFLSSYFGTGADVKLELPEYLYLSDGSEGAILAEARADAEGEPVRAVLRSIRYRY